MSNADASIRATLPRRFIREANLVRQPDESKRRENRSSIGNDVDCDCPTDGPHRDLSTAARMRALAPELQQLVQARAAPLVKIRTVSGQCNPAACVYQLTFADGETIKGRCFEKYSTACRVAAVSEEASLHGFPQLIAQNGRAVLEPWIVGTLFTDATLDIPHYRAVGHLLGRLHGLPTSVRWGEKLVHANSRCRKLDDRLQRLVASGGLSSGRATKIFRVARAAVPRDIERGFVHRDMCPRNLVISGAQIYSIDNATMMFGAYDEDLARTRCIWPMSQEQWTAFLAGYGTTRSADSFARHSAFWILHVAVTRAASSLRSDSNRFQQCIQRLEQLAAECESSAPIDLADAS